ncbi:MAG: hypothetical protein MJE63_30830 [Proteobacteria bacterium]|nr:hypothetical protein [Pseudomonadota bacterium]
MPKGVFSSSYELTTFSYNSILDGSQQKDLLKELLDRNSIGEEDIKGDLAYTSMVHSFKLQYGLFGSLNLAAVVPFVINKRESNLDVADTGNATHMQFASDYETAESQGLGDISLIATWRPIYNDSTDFRVRLELNGNNGEYYLSDSDNISLGNGANDLGIFMRWIVYSSDSEFRTDVEVAALATETFEITEDGTNYEIKKGNTVLLSIDLSDNFGSLNYGGGVKALTSGKTIINKVDQGDNYLAYSYRLFLNFGNLNQLEDSTVNLPWYAGFYFEDIFAGTNTPDSGTFGFKGTLYF